jgi:hypothetical protein
VNLALTTEEIGQLTMAQLAALNMQYEANRDHEDWRFAIIVCTLANLHRGKDQKALEPGDVMPWLRRSPTRQSQRYGDGAKAKDPEPRQTPAEMRAIIEEITREMGGIVHTKNVPLDAK